MLKDFSTLKICGPQFDGECEFNLFKKECNRATLIYGRNGSGKSTIAKSFKTIKGEKTNNINATLFDFDNRIMELSDDDKEHLFVFDEEFIDKNIRLKEDGLGAIVMLGEQVELSDEIDKAKVKYKKSLDNLERKQNEIEKYREKTCINSPNYYLEEMKAKLKKGNCWAYRDKLIREKSINTAITDTSYLEFIDLSPKQNRDELLIEFNECIKALDRAKRGESEIKARIPSIEEKYCCFDSDKANLLLKKKVEQPNLSEREKYLMHLVQEGHVSSLQDTANDFKSDDLKICPKCLQPLSKEYKEDLITSIQKILSKEIELFQEELAQYIIPELQIDLTPFKDLKNADICIKDILELNQAISKNNSLLELKKENPYLQNVGEMIDIQKIIEKLKSSLETLEKNLKDHNAKILDTTPIKENLIRINAEIAYYDIIEIYNNYTKATKEKEKKENILKKIENIKNKRHEKLESLKFRIKNYKVAIDIINDSLKYIFFSKDRLRISFQNDTYILLSKGKPVSPTSISVGERNIIALCYFFTCILKGKSKSSAYNEDYLIVIDDPISSFDVENKIGLFSYLKYQLSEFLMNNAFTKFLVMTHDLMSAIEINTLMTEITNDYDKKMIVQAYELTKGELTQFNATSRNEYSELLKIIYDYGANKDSEYAPYIGNIMRQVVESFSTFEYKKSIEKVSRDPQILSKLEKEEDRKYYKNLMYRFVLHGCSHRYNKVRNMQEGFLSMMSESDMKRTARDILCFIYLLNDLHLSFHLESENKSNTIKEWCEANRKTISG